MKSGSSFGLILLSIFVFALTSIADPRVWGHAGAPVRQGVYLVWDQTIAQNSQGYSLVVWSDSRSGQRDIYAQSIAPTGEMVWDPQGIAVVTEPHAQISPAVCAVNDGWIVAWYDKRPIDDSTRIWVMVQKIDMNGNRVWAANNFTGITIGTGTANVYNTEITLIDDQAGGASLAWTDKVSALDYHFQKRFQHINASGVVTLMDPLRIGLFSNNLSATCDDGQGNVITSWTEFTGVDLIWLRSQKISPQGTLLWSEAGQVVDTATGALDIVADQARSDGQGGCFLSYNILRDEESIRHGVVKHLSADGEEMWLPDGFRLWDSTYLLQVVPSYANGQIDGCFVIALGNFMINHEVTIWKIGPDGTQLWGNEGVLHGDEGTNFFFATGQTDHAGGLVIVSCRSELSGLYATRFDETGTYVWGQDPNQVLAGRGTTATITTAGDNCYFFALNGITETPSFLVYQQVNLNSGATLLPAEGQTLGGGLQGSCDEYCSIGMQDGRTAVVWNDRRESSYVTPIYYQILDSSGNPELALNGARLIPDSPRPRQVSIKLCDDGNGGFFCGFLDLRDETCILKLTHVNVTGKRLGDDRGNPVDPAGEESFYYQLVPDGTGGCYLSWTACGTTGQRRIVVMRMNSQCERVWNEPLVLSREDLPNRNSLFALASTSDGGCVAYWDVEPGPFLYGGKCIGDSVAWVTQICTDCSNNFFLSNSALPDTTGGVFVAWCENAAGNQNRLFVQHLDRQGNALWTPGGIALADFTFFSYPILIPSSNGSVYVLWQERSPTGTHLNAQRLAYNGTILWPQPAPIVMSGGESAQFAAVGDGNGNLFVSGANFYSNAHSLLGRYIRADRTPVDVWWEPTAGGLISDTATHVPPTLACLDNHKISVAWSMGYDDDATYGNLFAQAINVAGGVTAVSVRQSDLPSSYSLAQNYPNPFNPSTTIKFTLPRASLVSLTVFNILGQQVSTLIDKKMEAGYYSLAFDGSALPSGVYVYRMQSGDFNQCRKMVFIK